MAAPATTKKVVKIERKDTMIAFVCRSLDAMLVDIE